MDYRVLTMQGLRAELADAHQQLNTTIQIDSAARVAACSSTGSPDAPELDTISSSYASSDVLGGPSALSVGCETKQVAATPHIHQLPPAAKGQLSGSCCHASGNASRPEDELSALSVEASLECIDRQNGGCCRVLEAALQQALVDAVSCRYVWGLGRGCVVARQPLALMSNALL